MTLSVAFVICLTLPFLESPPHQNLPQCNLTTECAQSTQRQVLVYVCASAFFVLALGGADCHFPAFSLSDFQPGLRSWWQAGGDRHWQGAERRKERRHVTADQETFSAPHLLFYSTFFNFFRAIHRFFPHAYEGDESPAQVGFLSIIVLIVHISTPPPLVLHNSTETETGMSNHKYSSVCPKAVHFYQCLLQSLFPLVPHSKQALFLSPYFPVPQRYKVTTAIVK